MFCNKHSSWYSKVFPFQPPLSFRPPLLVRPRVTQVWDVMQVVRYDIRIVRSETDAAISMPNAGGAAAAAAAAAGGGASGAAAAASTE